LLIAAIGTGVVGACRVTTPSASAPATVTSPAPGVAGAAVPVDSFSAIRERAVAGLLQRIAGKENAPAESVFQNIKTLKGLPAGRLLAIMNEGFGHGLGVSCGFCHVPGQWASDQKPNKDVARDMIALSTRLNADLKSMRNLPDTAPMIGCITCHRGQQKPALITPSR
jgi:photosynthetic reaction center cytochrome c subunit